MANEVRIDFRNSISELEKLHEVITTFAETHRIGEEVSHAVTLALDEILTNVITYGCTDGKEHIIRLTLGKEGEEIRMVIEDDGIPFDPTRNVDPDIGASVEDRQVGGLGIYFAKRLTDSMTYRREGERNILVLSKRVGTSKEDDPARPGESRVMNHRP